MIVLQNLIILIAKQTVKSLARFLLLAIAVPNILNFRFATAGEICNPSLPINAQSFEPANIQCYQIDSVPDGIFYSILRPVAVDNTIITPPSLKGEGSRVFVDGQAQVPASGGFWTGASSVRLIDGVQSISVRDNSGNIYVSRQPINQ